MSKPLTKLDVKALQTADAIVIRINDEFPAGHVAASKRDPDASPKDEAARIMGRKVPQGWHHIVEAATVRADGKPRPNGAQYCEVLFTYPNQRCNVATAMKSLREGDEITFRFWADAHTSEPMNKAGVHGDYLFLDVYRKGHVGEFLLYVSICEENSARMCRGAPAHTPYRPSAAAFA